MRFRAYTDSTSGLLDLLDLVGRVNRDEWFGYLARSALITHLEYEEIKPRYVRVTITVERLGTVPVFEGMPFWKDGDFGRITQRVGGLIPAPSP